MPCLCRPVTGRRFFFLFITSILLVTILYVPGLGHANPPVKIAMVTAKTGSAGPSCCISFEGARFAVNEINAQGGILGRQVQLLEYDNQSTLDGSAKAGQQAVKDGAVAVVGCNWSSHSKAMAEVLQGAGVPMISHMSTNETVTQVGDYIFRICFTDVFQGQGLARFTYEDLRTDRVVVLVDTSRIYSIGLADTFSTAYRDLGGKIVWQGEYDPANVDYDALFKLVVEYDPEAVFIPGDYADVSAILERAHDQHFFAKIISADGVGSRLYDVIGKKAAGLYYSAHWSRWVNTWESKEFIRNYEKKVGPIQTDALPMVYDCFMLLKDAIERAESLDGGAIRDALASTRRFRGVTGPICFDAQRNPVKPMALNRLKFGGVMYLKLVTP